MKIGHLKRKQVFQPSIFRCELFPFREGTCLSLPPPSSGVKKSHSPMLLRFVVPHLPKYPNWNLKTSENRTVTLKLQKKTCLLAKSTKKWLIDTDFIGAIWMFICYYAHLRAAFEAFFPHAAAPVTKTSPHPPPPPKKKTNMAGNGNSSIWRWYMGVSKTSGTPKSSIFNRVFHYKL